MKYDDSEYFLNFETDRDNDDAISAAAKRSKSEALLRASPALEALNSGNSIRGTGLVAGACPGGQVFLLHAAMARYLDHRGATDNRKQPVTPF